MRDFFSAAATGHQFEGEASVEKSLESLGLKDQNDKLPGTNVTLYPHQTLGVEWMIKQEKIKKYRGGILADEMGLGKTVQMISLMAMNRSDDPKEKSTLILAPVALLEQWREEIESKTAHTMRVHVYHGNSKIRNVKELAKYDVVLTTLGTMAAEWVPCDDAAKKAAKSKDKKRGKEWTENDEADWHNMQSQRTPLFNMDWHRIVIDEAQNIRNRDTKSSRACVYLEARFRWCLTGTPVTNSLSDIFSLLRFLRIGPFNEWSEFRTHIFLIEKRQPAKAGQRVQLILKGCSIRRNKNSELNGKKLIRLPEKHVELVTLDFTPEEREIYEFVQTRSQERFNRYLKAGTVMKNYAQVLVMLLRLRQICGHPSLIASDYKEAAFEDPDAERKRRIEAYNKAVLLLGKELVEKIKASRIGKAIARMQAEKTGEEVDLRDDECDICYEALGAESTLITKCGHIFCETCLSEYCNTAQPGDEVGYNGLVNKKACPKCRQGITLESSFSLKIFEPTEKEIGVASGNMDVDEADDNYDQDIGKFMAKLEPKKKQTAREAKGVIKIIPTQEGSDVDEVENPSEHLKPTRKLRSRSKAAKRRVIKGSDDDATELSNNEYDSDDSFIDDSGVALVDKQRRKKGKGKGLIQTSEAEEGSEGDIQVVGGASSGDEQPVRTSFSRTEKGKGKAELVSPSKGARDLVSVMGKFIPSTKLRAAVQIIEAAPKDDKFMLISQWTSMLELTSHYLRELGIPHLRFQGDMSRSERDEAVKKFNKSPKYKCLLMSLKAGGVGLNLTGGNRVILLDLAWSPAVEGQAVDRLHRLGQTKEVFVKVIRDSVEDRILLLQANKQMLADAALGEGKGVKLAKLGIKELKMLFGLGPMPQA
ncbi:MAG: hypothetical protein CYPHOPRED_005227 [Cyphobasidiales sp. Tagirdzhanova-0007]|nr:MAG: hypothetical protein CYPHOPRED_005227 [Cyphobasidiales sp. Tagirdzhanova-0007]